ncbi:uncharacterized protein LOC130759434 [Actinidia eriantha]|uniref:uncharacterized protein LOC130759434 n=1 Tax=Actinidia eriantha TaxID=165200 RepID=UPI00258B6A33|nr:uncharacterized protein LOC130759434 [Actinidia eriantha]
MTISITEDTALSSPNHRMFTVDFNGTPVATNVTSSPKIVRKWLRTTLHFRRQHRHRLVVGLGVQWRPTFRSGEDSQAATLQLCVGRRCLIFQLIHSDTVPNFLRRFLVNPNHTFIGMWNHSDAKSLMNSKHELYMLREPLDLRLYAVSKSTGRSLTQESRETIVKECLGEDVGFDRWISRSEWDDEELSLNQILQACVEAYSSFEIGKDLRAWEL